MAGDIGLLLADQGGKDNASVIDGAPVLAREIPPPAPTSTVARGG